MSPFKRVSCLSIFVCVLGAMAAGAAPSEEESAGRPTGSFPAPEREFLLVNVGFSVCLTVVDGQVQGLPCVWEDTPPSQRWRHQGGQLVSGVRGECFLAPSLVPCRYTRSLDVSYDLLTQHLLLSSRDPSLSANCHVLGEDLLVDESTGLLVPRYVPHRAILESTFCAVTQASARWVILPLSP